MSAIGDGLLAGLGASLNMYGGLLAKDTEEEKRRLAEIEREKRQTEKEIEGEKRRAVANREQLIWQDEQRRKGFALDAAAQRDVYMSPEQGAFRAAQSEEANQNALGKIKTETGYKLNDPEYQALQKREADEKLRLQIAGRAPPQPQQPNEGTMLTKAMADIDNAKTPEEKAAAEKRLGILREFYGRGATTPAKAILEDIPDPSDPMGQRKIKAWFDPNTKKYSPATPEEIKNQGGASGPMDFLSAVDQARKEKAGPPVSQPAPTQAPVTPPPRPAPVAQQPAPQRQAPVGIMAPDTGLAVGQGKPAPSIVAGVKQQLQTLQTEVAQLGAARQSSPRLQEANNAIKELVKLLQSWGEM